jgi:hypothetical protein
MANSDHFFTKILCLDENHVFQVFKKKKKAPKNKSIG